MLSFVKKKECSKLLALLGEESWNAAKKRGDKPCESVSWVHDRIMTVECFGDNMLVRFAAVLHPGHADEVERRMQEAAMREEGYYHFSSRVVAGFVLAEITIYAIPESRDFVLEYHTMREKLDEALEYGGPT